MLEKLMLTKTNILIKFYLYSISGICLQAWLTKDGIYHEEQFPPVKRRPKHETREERKQRKYRYLYQVSIYYYKVQH